MNQIISYIYECKGEKQIQNSGFLKISFRGNMILVQMHLKGLALTNSEMLSLSIFFKEGDMAVIEKLQDLPVKNHSINMQISLSDKFFPSHRHLLECDGFLLRGPYGECYVASWKSVPFDTSKIRLYTADAGQDTVSVPLSQQPDKVQDTVPVPLSQQPAEAQDAVPVPLSQQPAEAQDAVPVPLSQPAACRKIKRSEMSVLPRRFWNLANNSFLLHGYYNFHHLILADDGDTYILGVPGLYDEKEARAADLFGFPDFSNSYISQVVLGDNEHTNRENFGYWCRRIPKLGS